MGVGVKQMKDLKPKWYSLEEILTKNMRSKKFRQAYTESQNRLKLLKQIRDARLSKKLTQKDVANRAEML